MPPAKFAHGTTHSDYWNRTLYKTEFCYATQNHGVCSYGATCHFAHSEAELRIRPRPAYYKTAPCRNYHTPGKICRYNRQCVYYHDLSEKRIFHKKTEQKPAKSTEPVVLVPVFPENPAPEIWQLPEVETFQPRSSRLGRALYEPLPPRPAEQALGRLA